ncbi:innexin inx1-like protein [Dinothrombium tinctorium]|uniref:Innexin n=1 Tax=Dinothrombium tinctorium TaxID=1965070 RepID=A0A3S4R7M3_9ACAR|nr:innexin inx1-like protein [Dinothrombium tinctorium]
MIDLFFGLKRLVKRRVVLIDNAIFRLHWLLTSVLLISCSVIITARQYVGNPIDCIQSDEIPISVLNTYCWIHTTFTIPEAFKKKVGVEVPHPGIENTRGPTVNKKYYSYYQWVCFALFIQGVLFYFPYYLWKLWEGGLIKTISTGMQIAVFTDEERGRKKKILFDYLTRNLTCHKLYAYKYFFCEFLCFVNVALQLIFTDWFFDGEFLDYGISVMEYVRKKDDDKVDPRIFVFPRMTKCLFYTYGSSGDVQKHDVLCMLPLNVVNEKIYLMLWFWFMFLLSLMIFLCIYRIAILLVTSLRAYFLKGRCRLSRYKDLKVVCNFGNIGDWFLLYMLGNNLDPLMMKELSEEMAKQLVKHHQRLNNGCSQETMAIV